MRAYSIAPIDPIDMPNGTLSNIFDPSHESKQCRSSNLLLNNSARILIVSFCWHFSIDLPCT